MKTSSVSNQAASAVIDTINQSRLAQEQLALSNQDSNFQAALKQIDKVREFVGKPEHILGSNLTKHGEIAEQAEVAITNAKDLLYGRRGLDNLRATFDGVGRTAPEDYLIDGIQVQSKFVNGTNAGLQHVLRHMEKYENFGRDSSYYHIPKEQYEIIDKIRCGEPIENLSQRSINAIQAKIKNIETLSGKSFDDVVKPSVSSYADIQQGKIHSTLDAHTQELNKTNQEIKQQIHKSHQASFSEALQAGLGGAAVAGTIALASVLYQKHKEGKNLFQGEFTADDWQDVGIKTGVGAVGGGITGLAVYGLTNCADLAAPMAGAFVTATKGVALQITALKGGEITFNQFCTNTLYLCTDSAGVCLGAMLGQTLIPIPILGAMLGSLAGKYATKILLEEDEKLAQQFEHALNDLITKIDVVYQNLIDKIDTEFAKFANLRQLAFDFDTNANLVIASIHLARAYGVPEHKILKSETDLKQFLFD
ncbi:MAG: hypothetical protein Q4A69_09180 [Moraxella sp.]|nr:hypothetical protein [Moraxella sp.]